MAGLGITGRLAHRAKARYAVDNERFIEEILERNL
jgi:hypothetical protein